MDYQEYMVEVLKRDFEAIHEIDDKISSVKFELICDIHNVNKEIERIESVNVDDEKLDALYTKLEFILAPVTELEKAKRMVENSIIDHYMTLLSESNMLDEVELINENIRFNVAKRGALINKIESIIT